MARCSPLERIFPAPNTHAYLDFTENPRYYNRLLDAWETKYSKRRPDAISLLREKCERKVHLEVPPNQPSARKVSIGMIYLLRFVLMGNGQQGNKEAEWVLLTNNVDPFVACNE